MSDPGAGTRGSGPSPDPHVHRRTARATIWAAVITGCATVLAGVLAAYVAGVFQLGPGPKNVSVVSSPQASDSSTDEEPGDGPETDTEDPEESTPPADDPTDEPTDEPTEEPTDDSGLTADEQDLADRVTGGDLSDCRSQDPGAYASVAINCESATGPGRDPLVLSFDDEDGMLQWMDEEESNFDVSAVATSCGDGLNYSGTWNLDGIETGSMTCHWDSGRFRMAWSFDDEYLVVVAEDPNATGLFSWWRGTPVNP